MSKTSAVPARGGTKYQRTKYSFGQMGKNRKAYTGTTRKRKRQGEDITNGDVPIQKGGERKKGVLIVKTDGRLKWSF